MNTVSTIVNGGRIDLTKPQRGSGVQAAASATEPDAVAQRCRPALSAPGPEHSAQDTAVAAHPTAPSAARPRPRHCLAFQRLDRRCSNGCWRHTSLTDLTRQLHLSEAGKAADPIKPSAGTSIAHGAGTTAQPKKLTHRTFFPKNTKSAILSASLYFLKNYSEIFTVEANYA